MKFYAFFMQKASGLILAPVSQGCSEVQIFYHYFRCIILYTSDYIRCISLFYEEIFTQVNT